MSLMSPKTFANTRTLRVRLWEGRRFPLSGMELVPSNPVIFTWG